MNQQEDKFSGGLGQAVNAKSGDLDKEYGNVGQLQSKDTDHDEMEQWL